MPTSKRLFNLMQAAEYKIKLRAKRPPDPAKWPLDGVDADGNRDWNRCDAEFLISKLGEESLELTEEVCRTYTDRDKIRLEAADVAAITMMIADKCGAFDHLPMRPDVVCLCGSTKFRDEFTTANFEETMAGRIVLSVGFFAHADSERHVLTDAEKTRLDDLHKRKIDMADEILVINKDGYVGDSTRSEVLYARQTGKPVRWRYLQFVDGMLQHTPAEIEYSFKVVKQHMEAIAS